METDEIKTVYNKIVKDKHQGEYEYNRWFKTPILKAGYDMTRRSIEYHLLSDSGASFHNYLELGSGAGTWTKLFAEKYNNACFDLVDISSEMLGIAKNALVKYRNVNFFESDFLEFNPEKNYDFFFSSRAIEYFPDKNLLAEKIVNLLKDGGRGFIITKTPKYLRRKILGKKTSAFHENQIDPRKLGRVLKEKGCGEIEIFPVTVSFPLFGSVCVNMFLYKIFCKYHLNFVSRFFSESYCIKFKRL